MRAFGLPDRAAEIRRELSDPRRLVLGLGLGKGAQRQAGGFLVRCVDPNHDDRGPSLSITIGPDGTIRAKCFGCPLTGDALTLVALANGLDPRRDFRAVLAEAGRLAGIDVEGALAGRSERKAEPSPTPPPAVTDEAFAALVRPLQTLGRLHG